ncbi:hypothetical protein V2A60_006978 [Cordyceps javanica]|uniref:Conidiation-specific protein n=1 Tax=Cordyceps javanica TaxID=43265 RepID=A0A545VRV3_9HYPO|nr:conidiation-specific protein [Cordyceps javanica]TQW04467.1 conidiation-specific protein [Cordyceps javanica]
MFVKTFTIGCISGAALVLAGNPDKPEMNPAFDYGRFEAGLRDNLHPTHSSWDYWGPGWIPQSCKDIATSHGLNPNDFTIFNVHYDDCQEGWTFCRHKDSGASEIDMIDIFGRAPVHMRSFIRHLVATPGLHDGAAAFTYSSGDCVVESAPDLSVMLHEISHSLDWHALPQYPSPFSSSGEWQSNYAQDSNTPTGYGRTNWLEDFAETGKVGVFDKVVPGGFGSIAGNWNQIFHQYATYQGYLGDTILPGGTCDKRFPNSETVPKNDNSKRADLGEKPDNTIKSENITLIRVRPEIEGQVAFCNH